MIHDVCNVSVESALYIDTPILTALQQVAPYFEYGIFDPKNMPIFIRNNFLVAVQKLFNESPNGIDVRSLKSSKLPVKNGGVVFYPFNSRSNMNAVTERQYYHVLTLHGESHKLASFRPSARLYDYICAAGPAAIDRYLDNHIFTRQDVDHGRLVQIGDSFVQRLPWLTPTRDPKSDGAVFWSPTWEGFSGPANNYSSVLNGVGFDVASRVAHSVHCDRIVIKPHPYMGTLKPSMWRYFISGVRNLTTAGFDVRFVLDDTPLPMRLMLKMQLPKIRRLHKDVRNPIPVRIGLTDVSGMEAALLVSGIPTMTIAKEKFDIPNRLKDIYAQKMIHSHDNLEMRSAHYLDNSDILDMQHRSHIFGYQDNYLKLMSGPERLKWVIDYVANNPFWNDDRKR